MASEYQDDGAPDTTSLPWNLVRHENGVVHIDIDPASVGIAVTDTNGKPDLKEMPLDERTPLMRFFKTFREENRIRIARILAEESGLHVKAIARKLGLSDSLTDAHIRWLYKMGYVSRQQDGRESTYTLTTKFYEEQRIAGTLLLRLGGSDASTEK